MIGRPFPGSPPVEQLLRGHLYQTDDSLPRGLLMYVRRGRGGGKGKKNYVFRILATNMEVLRPSDVFVCPVNRFDHMIKEIQIEDMPLYVDYKLIYPLFETIIKGGRERLEAYQKGRLRCL